MSRHHDPRRVYLVFASLVLACAAPRAATHAPDDDAGFAASVTVQPPVTAAGQVGAPPEASEHFELSVFEQPRLTDAPGIRWIWPGGAVDDATIEREVARIAGAGYGMIELQTLVAGLSDEEIAADARIRTVGEASFMAHVRTLARAAKSRGLSYDLTLGSGWPNGGVGVPNEASEQQMTWARVDVIGPGTIDVMVPPAATPSWVTAPVSELLTAGGLAISGELDPAPKLEAVVAAPVLDASTQPVVLGAALDISDRVRDGHIRWDVPAGPHALFALYRSRTSHLVLGAAFPGDRSAAKAIDHLGSLGTRWLVAQQLAPWLTALADDLPSHLFVDSLELTGELPWSDSVRQRYAARIGQSVFTDMPFLFRAGGETKYADVLSDAATPAFLVHDAEHAERAREEYESARADAFAAEYLSPVLRAAHERGVQLRLQAHGGWGVLLDDYARVDLPESESLYAGGSFDFVSLAGSAAHVAGRRKASMESFVTLNVLGPTGLDLDAMWQLAGLAFSAGINRLVHSICTYPYRHANGEAWYPLSTFTSQIEPGSEHWAFLSDFNRAQARIGYALSRGTPRVDLAWLKSERAQWDNMVVAVGGVNAIGEESEQSRTLRAAGFTYDRVSPSMLSAASASGRTLQVGANHYRALLVDDAHAPDPALLETLQAASAAGVPIVWVGAGPARAFGLRDTEARDARVKELWSNLAPRIVRVSDAARVAAALRSADVLPEVEVPAALGTIGIAQRDTEQGRLIWLFNESALPQLVRATVRNAKAHAQWLDPSTGRASDVALEPGVDGATLWLALPGARGGLLLLTD